MVQLKNNATIIFLRGFTGTLAWKHTALDTVLKVKWKMQESAGTNALRQPAHPPGNGDVTPTY